MPRSPQWMELYQIWFRVSSRGRNQLCGTLLQSAHGFRFCEGSKFAISHWLGRSPLTQCWRYRAACGSRMLKGLGTMALASKVQALALRDEALALRFWPWLHHCIYLWVTDDQLAQMHTMFSRLESSTILYVDLKSMTVHQLCWQSAIYIKYLSAENNRTFQCYRE